jgi:hypothetical protein
MTLESTENDAGDETGTPPLHEHPELARYNHGLLTFTADKLSSLSIEPKKQESINYAC